MIMKRNGFMKKVALLMTLAVFSFSASLVFGTPAAKSPTQKDRSNLPITIKSAQLSADNKGRTAIFTGKVVAKQGDVTIYSDKLTIYYGDKNNGDKKGEVEKIEADGNVRILQENRIGLASHAVYESKAGRIVLSGNPRPRVMQGSNTITGKTITYLIDDEKSIVTSAPDAPVEAIIHPQEEKK